jgi:hypothetical protein
MDEKREREREGDERPSQPSWSKRLDVYMRATTDRTVFGVDRVERASFGSELE